MYMHVGLPEDKESINVDIQLQDFRICHFIPRRQRIIHILYNNNALSRILIKQSLCKDKNAVD